MTENTSFSLFLKENSRATHDSVDELVMSVKPFDTPENYVKFLHLQAIFHKIVDDIYKSPEWNAKIANLAPLARYDFVKQDLHDVGAEEITVDLPLPQPQGAEALGWLYCAEGSNVGAAFLFKDAQSKLGYTAEHGARHLGPHAEGRGKHWRAFAEQLNALDLTAEERETALQGSLNAFAFYKVLLRKIFV